MHAQPHRVAGRERERECVCVHTHTHTFNFICFWFCFVPVNQLSTRGTVGSQQWLFHLAELLVVGSYPVQDNSWKPLKLESLLKNHRNKEIPIQQKWNYTHTTHTPGRCFTVCFWCGGGGVLFLLLSDLVCLVKGKLVALQDEALLNNQGVWLLYTHPLGIVGDGKVHLIFSSHTRSSFMWNAKKGCVNYKREKGGQPKKPFPSRDTDKKKQHKQTKKERQKLAFPLSLCLFVLCLCVCLVLGFFFFLHFPLCSSAIPAWRRGSVRVPQHKMVMEHTDERTFSLAQALENHKHTTC